MKHHPLIAIASLTVLASVSSGTEFLPVYEAAALRWDNRCTKNVKLEATGTSYDQDGKTVGVVKYQAIANDGNRLVKAVPIEKGVEQRPSWELLRPDGYYAISPSQSGSGYVLKRAQLGRVGWGDVSSRPLSVLITPFRRAGIYFPAHLANSATRLVSDEVEQGETAIRLIQLEERFADGVARTLYRFRQDDDFALDQIRVLSVSSANSERLLVTFHYQHYDGIGPYPAKVDFSLQTPDGKTRQTSSVQVNTISRASFPDSEFSLARFGLPGSVTYTPPGTSGVYLWILVAAGVCAGLAYFFRLLSRRWSNPTQRKDNGMKSLSQLLLFASLGGIGLALFVCVYPSILITPEGGTALVVQDANRDIGDQSVGTQLRLEFRVCNPTDRPLRIVGFGGG